MCPLRVYWHSVACLQNNDDTLVISLLEQAYHLVQKRAMNIQLNSAGHTSS